MLQFLFFLSVERCGPEKPCVAPCTYVLRKSVASHFSKGEGMSRIKL